MPSRPSTGLIRVRQTLAVSGCCLCTWKYVITEIEHNTCTMSRHSGARIATSVKTVAYGSAPVSTATTTTTAVNIDCASEAIQGEPCAGWAVPSRRHSSPSRPNANR